MNKFNTTLLFVSWMFVVTAIYILPFANIDAPELFSTPQPIPQFVIQATSNETFFTICPAPPSYTSRHLIQNILTVSGAFLWLTAAVSIIRNKAQIVLVFADALKNKINFANK